jgi:hypothetical protein
MREVVRFAADLIAIDTTNRGGEDALATITAGGGIPQRGAAPTISTTGPAPPLTSLSPVPGRD